VTERAASSTAVLVCQGRATADGRYAVGRFFDPIARELLDSADRIMVDRGRADRVPTEAADRMGYGMVRRTGLTMVPRTISIDDAIRNHAAVQLVILGAGLDARAWRMSELARATVFEVDHPASQQDKLRRIGGLAPTAWRVVAVPIDLASERLGFQPREGRLRWAGRDNLGVGGGRAISDRRRGAGDGRPDRGAIRAG
jgi:methyltransferase (TIGR00027 family)